MYTFAVFDVVASVDADKVSEFNTKVISCDLIQLNPAFLHVVRADTNEDGIFALLPSEKAIRIKHPGEVKLYTPDDDCVSPEQFEKL